MKKNGCLTWIIGFFVICLLIGLYSLAWIPAIGFIIYYLIKKDYSGTRKRNFIISIIIFITSLLLFIFGTNSSSLTDIEADWGKTTFDVSETVEVKITPTPSDAKIEKLTLSDNDIAKLKYKDGKAVVSFKKVGTATLTFTANDSIDSNATTITVKDKKAKEAAKKAKEEQKRLAEEKAKKEAEEKAAQEKLLKKLPKLRQKLKQRRQAAAQAQAQAEAQQQAQATAQAQQNDDPTVYITNTGGKYHRAGCRFLKQSQIEKHLSEVKGVYGPCGVCNPPQ